MKRLAFYLSVLVLFACNRHPYVSTNKQHKTQLKVLSKTIRQFPLQSIQNDSVKSADYFVGTTNFGLRKPNFVIIHHTAQHSCQQTLKTFTLSRTQVSSHYVVCKDGTVHQLLNDYLRAWHAGAGKWGNLSDINSSSIGIELDNDGYQPFPGLQLNALLALMDTLKKRYSIPESNFIGHADIAPARKNDPNIYFPWQQIAERGFGLWYSDTTGLVVPENFDHLLALRIVGYDTKDSLAAIVAFKRHFVRDTIPIFGNADRKILYSLFPKYQ